MSDTATPRLIWGPRPKDARCPCGREPLCGFADESGEAFWCAVCYDDGKGNTGFGRDRAPFFRTPEQRASILRGMERN